jgi:hypothetical protein
VEVVTVEMLPDAEVAAVVPLEPLERYELFLRAVRESGLVWVLARGVELALAHDDDGTHYLPVWPHPRYAEDARQGEWTAFEPTAVALGDWLEVALEDLAGDGVEVGVFPVAGKAMWRVTGDELGADLGRTG